MPENEQATFKARILLPDQYLFGQIYQRGDIITVTADQKEQMDLTDESDEKWKFLTEEEVAALESES